MNIFQVYKIILGIIVAVFVVTFLINFMGDYLGLNTQTNTYKAMNSFRSAVQDVYSTGNSVEFNQLSQRGMPECSIMPADETGPMHIKCGSIRMSFFTPLIFTGEKEGGLLIERTHLDYGWTNFYIVLAVQNEAEISAIKNTLEEKLLTENSQAFRNQLLVQIAVEKKKSELFPEEAGSVCEGLVSVSAGFIDILDDLEASLNSDSDFGIVNNLELSRDKHAEMEISGCT